ncbi:uncharacterized protein LOC134539712 isoform X2 [Bacillus rossius redtenbacheri]|uniref:uncharacterized protein LOC134539712 isoform X2 n=1 Tax=Bacillus rossius redtenbacheri TaxID=93214 RepID=UPI002FDCB149
MGQCVSCKAGKHARFYTTSSRSGSRRALTKMEATLHQNEVGNGCTKRPAYTRGQATLFGFKRRPVSASPAFVTPPSSGATSPDGGDAVTGPDDPRRQPQPQTPRPSRANKRPGAASRFGFRAPSAPPATNKVGDVVFVGGGGAPPPAESRGMKDNKGAAPPTRFTLHTSQLPRPQYPVRLSSADHCASSKGAKTAANNTRKEHDEAPLSSKEGSPTGDSGLGSAEAGSGGGGGDGDSDTLHNLELLDGSPDLGGRRRRAAPRRLLGTVVSGQFFDVRDLKDDGEASEDPNVITEISLISIPGTRVNQQRTGIVRERSQRLQQQLRLRGRSSSDEGRDEEDEDDEEKANRDRSSSEKVRSPPAGAEEELWGHGEAMAEGYTSSGDESPYSVTSSSDQPPPRPVLLTIEDCRFAAIAATAPQALLEDEKSPVDSVFSSSPPTSSAEDSVHAGAPAVPAALSPESPGTPTNASNSLSLSEGRDFLIDDEIADQPGLTFGEGGGGNTSSGAGGCSSQMASVVDSSLTLVDSSPRPVRKLDAWVGDGSPARGRRVARVGSPDTLSPCESLASDDLMMDFDGSQASLLDGTVDSQADVSSGPIDILDEETLMSEIDAKSDLSAWEWSSPLGAQKGLPTSRPSILRSRPGSTPDSPRSLDSASRPVRSPLRLPRQLNGPSDADDSSVRLDRGTYQYMFQDIVSIKTMLLKLNRILQEADTLNPFDTSLKNGLFYSAEEAGGEDGGAGATPPAGEEVADLRRQVVLLQSQLEDKERTIKQLQLQVMQSSDPGAADTCNAATQTERMRPVSAGPSLLHSLPSEGNAGPLVSSSDKWRQRPAVPEASDCPPASRLPTLSRAAPCNKRGSAPSSAPAPPEQSRPPARKLSSSSLLRKMAVS